MSVKVKKRRMKMGAGDRAFVIINSTLLILLFIIMFYPMIFVLALLLAIPRWFPAEK